MRLMFAGDDENDEEVDVETDGGVHEQMMVVLFVIMKEEGK